MTNANPKGGKPSVEPRNRWSYFRIYSDSIFENFTLRWYNRAFYWTLITAIIYLICHYAWKGEEIVVLNGEQLAIIEEIVEYENPQNPKGDTLEVDSTLALTNPPSQEQVPEENKIEQISAFLKTLFDLEKAEADSLQEDLSLYPVSSLPSILKSYPIKVKSTFWLTPPWVFFEIIFWSLFGLAASILYRVSEAMSKQEFDRKKVPIQIAKIIYAPLSTLIIIFSYDRLFSGENSIFLSLDYGIIVVSFMLGFFSGRTIDLLKRIKDLLLPLGGDNISTLSRTNYPIEGVVSTSGLDSGLQAELVSKFSSSKVQLLDSSEPTKVLKSVPIGPKGGFQFKHIEPGDYQLKVQIPITKEGMKLLFGGEKSVKVPEEVQKGGIEIQLHQKPPKQV